jgi:hypothetical protein
MRCEEAALYKTSNYVKMKMGVEERHEAQMRSYLDFKKKLDEDNAQYWIGEQG